MWLIAKGAPDAPAEKVGSYLTNGKHQLRVWIVHAAFLHIAVLCTIEEGPHAIPVADPVRAGDRSLRIRISVLRRRRVLRPNLDGVVPATPSNLAAPEFGPSVTTGRCGEAIAVSGASILVHWQIRTRFSSRIGTSVQRRSLSHTQGGERWIQLTRMRYWAS